MAFPQSIVDSLLLNRSKILRYMFIPQLIVAVLFLGFAYRTGKEHGRLLMNGVRTPGTIVGMKAVQIAQRPGTRSSSFSRTTYLPQIEFRVNDRLIRFQEWKGTDSSGGLGSTVLVIYDPSDSFFAMMDRGAWNWLPWAPCFVIGGILLLAGLKGMFSFAMTRETRESEYSRRPRPSESFAHK
jgi:hypothetical protein